MKNHCAVLFVLLPLGLNAQLAPAALNTDAGGAELSVTARDASSSTVTWTESISNAVTGAVSQRNHSYVQVGSGLNYQDEAGQWQPSQDLIELTADGGAAALRGPHKVHFNPNLNTQGVIALTTVSNRVFRSSPLALYYFNAETGQSALIAQVKDSIGELHPPNQLVYPDCLEGANAEYRVTYTKADMEADLVLTAQLPPPETFFGTVNSRSVRLEWVTEFLDPPTPQKRTRILNQDAGEVVEIVLDFGDVWFSSGRAFLWDGSTNSETNTPAQIRLVSPSSDTNQVVVTKRWLQTSDGRTVLVESVNWQDIAPKLESLPQPGRVASASNRKDRATQRRQLPTTRVAERKQTSRAIKVASLPYTARGVVWDYIIISVSYPNTFQSGVTYFFDWSVYTGDTLTFEPNCILKFASGNYALSYGGIVCNGTASNPSIFTSKDDDLFGEKIYGSTGTPTYSANPAINTYYLDSSVSITGVRIRWASIAVEFDSNDSSITQTLQDSWLEQCQTGVYANNCSVSIAPICYKCGVSTPTTGAGTYSFSGSFSDGCYGDTDSDGLPDSWETTYFGNITSQNGTGDPDGDGLTNYQEYLAGTHPNLKVWITSPKGNSNIP